MSNLRWLRVAAAGLPLLIAAGLAAGEPAAQAFSLPVHETIVRRALSGKMSGEAMQKVIGDMTLALTGSGNHGQDTFSGQYHAEHHFDSARNPAEVCQRWTDGLGAYMDTVVRLSRPEGDEKKTLVDRDGALDAFGKATHAIADFYSHSNWVEMHAAAGVRPPAAPILGGACNPDDFPSALQTGFADMNAEILNAGASWCPDMTPPEGFTDCHDSLAKDEPNSGHGAQPVGRPGNTTFVNGETYHTVAVDLAVQATAQAWDVIRGRIIKTYDDVETDGECVFRKLAQGGDESCLKRYRIEVNGTVGFTDGGAGIEWTIQGSVPLTRDKDGHYQGKAAAQITARFQGDLCYDGSSRFSGAMLSIEGDHPAQSSLLNVTSLINTADGIASQATCLTNQGPRLGTCGSTGGAACIGAGTRNGVAPLHGYNMISGALPLEMTDGTRIEVPRPAALPGNGSFHMALTIHREK